MYIKIGKSVIEKIQEITKSDYECDDNGLIPSEQVHNIIEELLNEIYELKDEIRRLNQSIYDDYKPKQNDEYDELGLSRKDFF